jgi:hypothetical protein
MLLVVLVVLVVLLGAASSSPPFLMMFGYIILHVLCLCRQEATQARAAAAPTIFVSSFKLVAQLRFGLLTLFI